MGQLGARAIEKVSGPAWDRLRDKFMSISDKLLAVSPNTCGELTTIYVKFTLTKEPSSPVFAAVWLKNSKSLTVGFSLPDGNDDPLLTPPPAGMRYKGLTRYCTITPDGDIPDKFGEWADIAFHFVTAISKTETVE